MSRKSFNELSRRRKNDYLQSIFKTNTSNNTVQLDRDMINQTESSIQEQRQSAVERQTLTVDEESVADFSSYAFGQRSSDVNVGEGLASNQNENRNFLIARNASAERMEMDEASSEDTQTENFENRERNIDEEDRNENIDNRNESDDDVDNDVSNRNESDDDDDDNVSNGNDDDTHDFYDTPLYTNAPIPIAESMLLIQALLLKHNITQVLLEDILTVINLHTIPNNEQFDHSLHKFNKYFAVRGRINGIHNKYYHCSNCLKNLDSNLNICEECNGLESVKVSYFIDMPFLMQLGELFQRRSFYEKLQHRFQRPIIEEGMINDLYDGRLYREFVTNGFLANGDNISLTWYADGVPVYKSSKISMWPIYLSINELPFKERTKRSNLLLAGLWFGKNKPDGNIFFRKLKPQFKDLFKGQKFTLSDGQIKTIRGMLLYGTCDLPAKAQFLNLTQFNGAYGCPSCLCPGETFNLPSGGTTHIYPYTENPPLRTTPDTIRHGRIALGANNPVMGVKGPCILSSIMPDFIVGTTIDRMHGVDGGVVKKLLTLWFSSTYSDRVFSLCLVKDVVNESLLALKPPTFIHRMPRSIDELSYWKASELKVWFFYYSVPLLHRIMDKEYFDHYLLLVAGVSYLNSDKVSYGMIFQAQNFLIKFVREFEKLYGKEFCSINVHQLLHLSQCVRDNGPLWSYSCYQYENLNGKFLNAIHGTRHIDTQVSRAHMQLLKMEKYLEELPDGPIRNFCSSQRKQVKILEKISQNVYTVGTYQRIINDDEGEDPVLLQIIHDALNDDVISVYFRLLKNNVLFKSEKYHRTLHTQSSYVVYEDNNTQSFHFGSIYCFLKKHIQCNCRNNNCMCNTHYAVIRTVKNNDRFRVIGDNILNILPHLYECKDEENFILIKIEFIQSICVHMNVNNESYVAVPINNVEDE